MPRSLGSPARSLAVWLGASTAAALALISTPPAWSAARSASGAAAVSDLVVAACVTGLALSLVWLWLVTTVTVLGLLRGRTAPGGVTRRLVLLACGVAVVAGTSAPSLASGGDGSELLAGLSLPERAVAPHQQRAEPRPAAPSHTGTGTGTYVVRPGDSLSSIALAHPGAGSLDDRWRALWRANRDVVGDDPDLIHPGQALRLPGTHHEAQTQPDEDGDRS
ncbi:LysM peptidoglycan-binding domain-containing protein [Nocardioides glacieisoli]|uniref:LysM peptidoglycan-binding domain-containing protein n=1 Tax=Nocardioides glacieisoli TaxID=1168730 RepID=UPI001A9268FA|nr:LysM domain-containing protein [Nocardioides glacieisoli]